MLNYCKVYNRSVDNDTKSRYNTNNEQSNYFPKFSIIIPVYNCEKYIAKALDSLINQDYPERVYEIIITDDGSTDSTGRILDSYAGKFPFIRVTHTQNYGPSHARNIAISQCASEYIMFCDADDFVSPQLISVVSKAIELYNRPDFVVFRHFMNFTDWPVYNVHSMKREDGELFDGEELCFRILCDNVVGGFSANKAIRREVLGKFRYDESLAYCEDVDLFINIILHSKNLRVCRINCFLYCYVQHENSGQTRDAKNVYTADGLHRLIIIIEKLLALENLPKRAAEQVKCRLYEASVNNLYARGIKPSRKVYGKLRKYMREYAHDYYSHSVNSFLEKAKIFVKHILVLLHIHK